MKKYLLALLMLPLASYADLCPDPNHGPLSTGEVPPPWHVSPFSERQPQGEPGTRFIRANILVIAKRAQGVICTYQNSVGHYSIWWPVHVKLPPDMALHWYDSMGGYECRDSLTECVFYPAYG